jgi:hypothetical protein
MVMRVLIGLLLIVMALASVGCDSIFGIGDHELAAADAARDGGPEAAPDTGTLIFDEEFDGAVLDDSKWVIAGNGKWSIEAGRGIQSNGQTLTSMIYAKEFVDAGNYHIIARMRSTGPFGEGHALAPEIAFRVTPSVDAGGIPEDYHCDFNLLMNQLILDQTTPGVSPDFAIVAASVPSDFDAGTPFVLDLLVSGTNATCTLTVDALGSMAMTTALTLPTGSFGLKTYDTAAQFYYFRVYAAD